MRWYIHTTIYDILKHKYRLVLLPHICLSWGLPSLPIQAPIWSGFHVIYKMKRRQRTRTLQGVSQMDGKWCHPLRPLKTFPTKKLQCINIFWFIYGSHFIPWCFSKLSTHSCELLRLLVSSWGSIEFAAPKHCSHWMLSVPANLVSFGPSGHFALTFRTESLWLVSSRVYWFLDAEANVLKLSPPQKEHGH